MNKLVKQKLDFKRLFLVVFGLFLYAFGLTAFLIPNGLVGGGIGGIATIIYFATDIPVGLSNLVINVFLVILAIKIMGARFGFNTIFGIVTSSLFLMLLQYLIKEPLVEGETFMNALIGGAFSGTGLGIAIANGGNSGGTDIIALIVNKYRNISPGRTILYCDVIIIASSWFVFYTLDKIVFGYVVMAVVAYTIDLVLNGEKQSYQFMIISKKSEAIAKRITDETGRGITALPGKGWFTQQERDVLMIIGRKTDRPQIMRIVKDVDNDAFISVSKVSAVFGQNFDPIRI